MVERLFTGDVVTSDGNSECKVTNLTSEWNTFHENVPRPAAYSFLPTINENSEGFQSATGDQATIERARFRTRRNSHPISFRDGILRTNWAFAKGKPAGGTRKCKQGLTGCRKCNSRDPMLSFKMLPKQDNIVFEKHTLDKIDEGDLLTESNEENDPVCCQNVRTQGHIVDTSTYSQNTTVRRSSYPVDSTALQQNNILTQNIRDFKQCQEGIVSKWMKFF
jgi:hypothetical protein